MIEFKKGETYQVDLGLENYKVYILEIVEGMIVYKHYLERKQKWLYEIVHPMLLHQMIEGGEI